MNRFFRIAVCALLIAVAVPFASAKKQKIAKLYDSKSWIVPVVSDRFDLIENAELGSKMYPIEYNVPNADESQLNAMNFGNTIVNILTKNGTSEELLRKIALKNMQKQDEEFASETMRVGSGDNVANVVAEDYLPILTHCYFIVNTPFTYTYTDPKTKRKEERTGYRSHLYRVVISNDEAFDIMSCIGDPQRYAALPKFKVEHAFSSTGLASEDSKKLTEQVPDLALRGVITRRHPAQISIGENAGLKKGDLVSVFSQRMDKNGNMYSKRISRARVGKTWDDHAQVNFEAAMAGNRKNGDVVVRTPDNHLRASLLATYSPHVWGGELLLDSKTGFTRSGIIHHFLFDLGFNMTDHPGAKFIVLDQPDYEFKAPMWWNVGMGYGISKTFLGFMDFMPYFLVQYEGGFMIDTGSLLDENNKAKNPYGSFVRVPIGLRFSFNIGYPLRLAIEGGYALNYGIGGKHKVITQTCDLMGAKRKGFFLNLGLIF